MRRQIRSLALTGLLSSLIACGGGGGGGSSNSVSSTTKNIQISEATLSAHNMDRLMAAKTPSYIGNGGVVIFLQETQAEIYPNMSLAATFNVTTGAFEKIRLSVVDSITQASPTTYQCGPDNWSFFYPTDVAHNFPCTATVADLNKKTISLTKQKMWMVDSLDVYVTGGDAKSVIVNGAVK
jgi:hypothetical protein